jgi:hypothetical protein
MSGAIGNPEMRLCVGMNRASESVLSEELQSKIEDFCIENAMEFIDMDQKPIEQGLMLL